MRVLGSGPGTRSVKAFASSMLLNPPDEAKCVAGTPAAVGGDRISISSIMRLDGSSVRAAPADADAS